MPDLELDLGRPSAGATFGKRLNGYLPEPERPIARIRAGFAFATRGGVWKFCEELRSRADWPEASKLWLLGIHHGITEPSAIMALGDLPRSEVRLFTGNNNVRKALTNPGTFHAKVVAVETSSDRKLSAFHIGSANLTNAAYGAAATNFEAGVTIGFPLDEAITGSFNSWWETAWTQSIPATPGVIQSYTEERGRFLAANPALMTDPASDSPETISKASFFWIEAGPMRTGGSHNAIEFSSDLASFFGNPSQDSRRIIITAKGKRWTDRPLSPKTTSFGVKIWRLSLPTIASGGFDYAESIIAFTKQINSEGSLYNLEVTPAGSQAAREWYSRTQLYGSVGRTGGGHIYGFML